MDRVKVYPGQLPLETDVLRTNQYAMVGLAKLAEAVLGGSTAVDGLGCVPTSPASMEVTVEPGVIFSMQNLEATAYSSLDADTDHQILKQGILLDEVNLSCPAPATVGQSRNYLVQATFTETDTDSETLLYYNASDPSVAWSGPNNSGDPDTTTRKNSCVVSVKAGTAATTGTQTTPAPDAGYVGLWVVTVAQNDTTITAGNIKRLTGAPFLDFKLGALGSKVRTRLTADTTFYVATAGTDANDGLSSGRAWATLQKAWNTIRDYYDLAGFTATVQVAAGTYTAGLATTGELTGEGSVVFLGDTTTPSNVHINVTNGTCFSANNGSRLQIRGFKLSASGSGTNGVGIAVSQQSLIYADALTFGVCGTYHINATGRGIVFLTGSYSITGGAALHWNVVSADIIATGLTVTITGTPAFSSAFAGASSCGVIYAANLTFSGSATGARYNASKNGVIDTNGGGASYLPGNSVGSTATGGQYT